jgi:hypothetical protein
MAPEEVAPGIAPDAVMHSEPAPGKRGPGHHQVRRWARRSPTVKAQRPRVPPGATAGPFLFQVDWSKKRNRR